MDCLVLANQTGMAMDTNAERGLYGWPWAPRCHQVLSEGLSSRSQTSRAENETVWWSSSWDGQANIESRWEGGTFIFSWWVLLSHQWWGKESMVSVFNRLLHTTLTVSQVSKRAAAAWKERAWQIYSCLRFYWWRDWPALWDLLSWGDHLGYSSYYLPWLWKV